MLIPLGTDRSLRRPTVVNYGLMAACAVVFLIQMLTSRSGNTGVIGVFGSMVLDSHPTQFRWWQLFSYQFLHGGFGHLLGNMVFLFVFGANVEDRFGRWWYLLFYLAGGACAGASQIVFSPGSVIGASGSIAAVTGAYLVFFPRTHIKTLLFFFMIGIFWIPSMWFIGFAIAKDLVFQGFSNGQGVAYMAHIGGYSFGFGISMALLGLGVMQHEHCDLFGISKQAHRRRQFKELAAKGDAPWVGEVMHKGKQIPVNAEAQAARASISTGIRSRDAESSIEAYGKLLEHEPGATLPRQQQLDIANYLFQASSHEQSAQAYARFLDKFPRDSESPRVHLLLGLLYARYLGKPEAARALLVEAKEKLHEESQRELAGTILDEIGSGS